MERHGSLSQRELETFLEESTIPIRIGCRTPSGHPWMVSMWYRYRSRSRSGSRDDAAVDADATDDWYVECATAADADIVSFLEADSEVSFEISTNEPPYAGVRGRDTASIEPDPEKETLRALLERYLGGTDSQLAARLLREDRDEVTIRIEPAVVSGWDYAERMRDATASGHGAGGE